MSLPSYGIPGDPSNAAKVDRLLTAQAEALNLLVGDLHGAADTRLLNQQQGIEPITDRLNRVTRARVGANSRVLAPMIHTLDSAVSSKVSENQVAINLLPQSVQSGVTEKQFPTIPQNQLPTYLQGALDLYAMCLDALAPSTSHFVTVQHGVNPASIFGTAAHYAKVLDSVTEDEVLKFMADHPPSDANRYVTCPTGIPSPAPVPQPVPQPQPQPQPSPQPTPTTVCPPCTIPEPSPPAITPTELPVGCPDYPSDTPTDDWCKQFIILRQYMVSVGQMILEAGEVKDRLPNVPLAVFTRLFTELLNRIDYGDVFSKALEYVVTSKDQTTLIRCWVFGLKNILGIQAYDVLSLYAVRRVLMLIESYEAHGSGGQARSQDLVSATGLDLAGMGLGTRNTKSEKEDVSLSGSMHPFIVPAIQLIDRMIESLLQNEVPSIADAIQGFLKGTIDEYHFRCLVEINGGNYNEWYRIVQASRERLDDRELIEFARRTGVDDATQIQWLRARGWINADEATAKITLYDTLPTIQEHLHWLQRNVFDDDYVRDFNLLDGFLDRFWTKFGQQLYAQGFTQDRAALHYAAHWINPAPGQLAEMMQRLRPGRVTDDLVFDSDSYKRVLAEQDVAPYFRDKFLATSFELQPRSYVQQLFFDNVIDGAEVIERYRDLGFSIEDSNLMQQEDTLLKARNRAKAAVGYSPQSISDLYLVGILSPDNVAKRMQSLGYTVDEATALMEVTDGRFQSRSIRFAMRRVYTLAAQSAISAYGQGTIDRNVAKDALLKSGWPDGAAETALDAEDIKVKNDSIKQVANKVKRSYLDGAITILEATNILAQMGVANARVQDWINTWSVLLDANRKVASAAKALQWLEAGYIDIVSARNRLNNLGWREPEISLYIAEAGQKIADREARALKAEQSNERRAANELAKLARQAQQQTDRLQSSLRRRRPVSRLMKWLNKQYISQDWFNSTLQDEGYTPEEIQLYTEQALSNGTTPKA